MKRRQVFVLCISFVIVILLCTACTRNNEGAANSTPNSETSKETPAATTGQVAASDQELPFKDTPAEISITLPENPVQGVSYSDNLPVFQEIEKNTGVKIKWDPINNSDGTQYDLVMNTRIASASGLSDLFLLPQGVDILKLIKGNLILPLDDLIEKHAPNLKRFFAENPDIAASMRTPDGKTYVLPGTVYTKGGGQDLNPLAFMYRHDWAEKVGVTSDPVTIDDWHNLFTLIKTKDPNGNGKADEVPFVGRLDEVTAFASAYGIHFGKKIFYPDSSGKIQYGWMLPAAKEFFTEMNKWYKEGLIDKQFLSITWDQIYAKWLDDTAASTFVGVTSNADWANKNNKVYPNADWMPVAPPMGPSGDKGFIPSDERYYGYVAVSAATQNPELVIKWVDYVLAHKEGSIYPVMGIKDVHWTEKDGKKVYTDAILMPEGKWWENEKKAGIDAIGIPHESGPDFYDAIFASFDKKILNAALKVSSYKETLVPTVLPTDEESDILKGKMVDIETFAKEMVSKFILGNESIDHYDSFVEKLKQMGIEEVIKVKQAQYDRAAGK